ncbi:MAG: YdcF family protein [Ignavibacteria bacterium]|nr:YdcF family protein [Ignavibacteria bacterium]
MLLSDTLSYEGMADAACVAGGDSGPRAERAFALYRAGRVPRIVFLSKTPGLYASIPPYTAWDSASIRSAGVRVSDVLLDGTTRNTEEEAGRVRDLSSSNGWRSVIIISDPPHMRRLRRIYTRQLSSTPLVWHLDPVSLPYWRTEKWWCDRVAFEYGIRETVKNIVEDIRQFFPSE